MSSEIEKQVIYPPNDQNTEENTGDSLTEGADSMGMGIAPHHAKEAFNLGKTPFDTHARSRNDPDTQALYIAMGLEATDPNNTKDEQEMHWLIMELMDVHGIGEHGESRKEWLEAAKVPTFAPRSNVNHRFPGMNNFFRG